MKIADVICYPYRIPFRKPFTTAHGTLTHRTGAIVEIRTVDGISGFGEIAPLSEFGGSTLAESLAALPDLVDRIKKHKFGVLEAQAFVWTSKSMPRSLRCGLETALFDLFDKYEPHVFLRQPSNKRDRIAVNATIGSGSIEETVQQAQEAVLSGFRCLKLKIGDRPQDIERIAAVRHAIGSSIHLRLDANATWTYGQAVRILSQCASYDVQYVEQPLPSDDLEGMQRLRKEISIPIAADESLYMLKNPRSLLTTEAADILIIKPQLIGGSVASRNLIEYAAKGGVQSVITSTLEAGIGMVAALHRAVGSPEITLECGLATLDLLEDDLIIDPPLLQDGFLMLPKGPGLGVQLDRAALEKYSSHEVTDQ